MPNQQLATEIAAIYKDVYGRGPQKIVATIIPDAVFVVLEEVNTPGQLALVELDEIELLHRVHERLQHGMGPRLCAAVEGITGRTVRSYVPGFNGRDGTAVDTFLLEPVRRS